MVFWFLSLHFSLALAEEFRYDNHGKRDPFLSPALAGFGAQLGQGELQLQGVIVDPVGGSYAIVNEEIVREGDVFKGFLLKKVGTNEVLFEKDGESLEIILRDDEELMQQYREGRLSATESASEETSSKGKEPPALPKQKIPNQKSKEPVPEIEEPGV